MQVIFPTFNALMQNLSFNVLHAFLFRVANDEVRYQWIVAPLFSLLVMDDSFIHFDLNLHILWYTIDGRDKNESQFLLIEISVILELI